MANYINIYIYFNFSARFFEKNIQAEYVVLYLFTMHHLTIQRCTIHAKLILLITILQVYLCHSFLIHVLFMFVYSQLAKQKVKVLAQKIAYVWKGEYFLVVVHSFIPRNGQQTSGIFHKLSLHHEGRALDLTLGRKNGNEEIVTIYRDPDMKTKLKELATLARSGELKFNFVKITGHHIHVSTKRNILMMN